MLDDLHSRLPASLELTLGALILALGLGIPLGVGAALTPGGWIDRLCSFVSTIGQATPTFFLGLSLVFIFYYLLGWAPAPLGRLDIIYTSPTEITGFWTIDAALAGDWETFRAVLAQLIRKDQDWRCGVDIVGVANWQRVIENWPPFWRNRHMFHTFFGDPAVPAEREPERGVAAGVDDAHPHTPAGPGAERPWRCGQAAVDEVVRVLHIAGVAAEEPAGGTHEHDVHVHTAHAVHAVHALAKAGQHLVGRGARTVDPVVQDHGPFLVVRSGLGRVLHDQRGVQAPVQLDAGVRVEPVGARILGDEPIRERLPGFDGRLRDVGGSVHVVP